MTKTYIPPTDTIERKWYVVDAADQRLGRLATEIATVLRGKKQTNLYAQHGYWRFRGRC